MGLPFVHISFKYHPNRVPAPARGIVVIGQFMIGEFILAHFVLAPRLVARVGL